jgi:hypothetical protein
VLGDNRGDSAGEQPVVFRDILQAVNKAAPDLLLHVGDMINGYPGDEETQLRMLWGAYREAIVGLQAPVYHAPGNHDLFDQVSARLWQELWGPTYYAFERNGCCFIALDTETQANRLGENQFGWLAQQLEQARGRPVFLFLHRPLFPVNGHRGISLDSYPEERDRLHNLFVRHRADIQGVFQGHEHLYHFEERDGVPYYILGGGGEELYVPPELGGFHHFLVVRVHDGSAAVEVRKAGACPESPRPVISVPPQTVLEGWESTLFWYTWDHSVKKELTRDHATRGEQGLKVWFDMARYEWPALIAPLNPVRNLSGVDSFCVDVYVPHGLAGLAITLLLEARHSHEVAPLPLNPGWNEVVIGLNDSWISKEERAAVQVLQWVLTADERKPSGWVVFDNFRAEKIGDVSTGRAGLPPAAPGATGLSDLSESWEGKMLWGVYDETVRQEPAVELVSRGQRGLKVRFDLAKFNRPLLYASVNPLWDLSRVGSLATDIYLPPGITSGLGVSLSLLGHGKKYQAPPVSLLTGWNPVRLELCDAWLPPVARKAIEQIEWSLSGPDRGIASWVIFGHLRTEPF